MRPSVDVVLTFRSSSSSRQEAQEAEGEYNRLISTLSRGGLKVAGKRTDKNGQLMVLVGCPQKKFVELARLERHSDFINGLPISSAPSLTEEIVVLPAERIRLIHDYVTTSPKDGGLGVMPNAPPWTRLQSVTVLHDKEFNNHWIKSWTTTQLGLGVGAGELERVRSQFGESLALYFAFLSSYARFLIVPSAAGLFTHYYLTEFSPIYSLVLSVWSIVFVEWWRIRERTLSVKWGTRGLERTEKRRPEAKGDGDAWWVREVKIMLSLPVIAVFASFLTAVLTSIFIFEAFFTHIYTGPGASYLGYIPTVLFVFLIPRILAFYGRVARQLTGWENHLHQSTYYRSLTLKTFALSAIVAYGGLTLTSYVYIPFGQQIMTWVHTHFSEFVHGSGSSIVANEKWHAVKALNDTTGLINPDRLKNQMYAYSITNQIIGTFLEIGLPYVMRGINAAKNKKLLGGKKKNVQWQDEKAAVDAEEKELLGEIQDELELPEYAVFDDYAEMVTQFGFVTIWSTAWPLNPVFNLINNWLELRSDAFKITHHVRRPVPARTDTMGPWFDVMSLITWLGALNNTALIFLFNPATSNPASYPPFIRPFIRSHETKLVTALLLALASSHAYIVVRAAVAHLLQRALWIGSKEQMQGDGVEADIKRGWLRSVLEKEGQIDVSDVNIQMVDGTSAFWTDEGVEAIRGMGRMKAT